MVNIHFNRKRRLDNIKCDPKMELPIYKMIVLMELICVYEPSFKYYTDLVRTHGEHKIKSKG